jgi:tetratricopeptide (TPR) repeat protein
MPELCLHLTGAAPDAITAELCFRGERQSGGPVDLRVATADLAHLRWLWEDPVVDLYDPGSGRRGTAERAVRRVGEVLGKAFAATEPMRRLFERALDGRDETVVLVSSGHDALLELPWELARTAEGVELYTLVGGLARQRVNVPRPAERSAGAGPLRVLLVVSRPAASRDVPYQAIAAPLLSHLNGRARVTMVRPGTFTEFVKRVAEGGWDLVHYDGHGTAGKLAFEGAMVSADNVGRVLRRAGIPVFVLNACQSAAALPADAAAGSVARVLVDSGAVAVVAMGAAVRVSAAVTFFDCFYEELVDGAALSRACHRARQAVEAEGRPLDWAIPVLYLREDVAPFDGRRGPERRDPEGREGPRPMRPGGIFLGRDAELYIVDRALDGSRPVLLYGVGGIGKTTLVEHLLDWRRRTDGADRVMSFSFRTAPSFELMVQQLLAELDATRPERARELRHPEWAQKSCAERLCDLGEALADDRVTRRLFLFDNVELLSGYPDYGAAPYSEEERAAFVGLLDELEGSRCRVVLTSRRNEMSFLKERVRRIQLRGVRGRDRFRLLLAYAEAFGSDETIQVLLRGAGDGVVLDRLVRTLAGHPLATRVAAYGLVDRSVDEVLASIEGKAEEIRVPYTERTTRSEALEVVVAAVVEPLVEERRRALGLLGLCAGSFHEADFVALFSHPEFPPGIVPDRSEAAVREVIVQAHRLGLIGQAEGSARVWEVIPGAQGPLGRLWRASLTPDAAASLERHFLRYWTEAAGRFAAGLHSLEAGSALQAAEVAEACLRRALELADREHDWNAARPILALLLELWPMRGRVKEAAQLRAEWSARVCDPATGGPVHPAEGLVRLWFLLRNAVAEHAVESGRVGEGFAIYQGIATVLGENPAFRDLLASVHAQLGWVERFRGNLDEAERWYLSARSLFEAESDLAGMALAYFRLGRVEIERGNLDAAEDWYHRSLGLQLEIGDRRRISDCYYRLGKVEMERGRLNQAEEWMLRSVEIDRELGDVPSMANTYHQLGRMEQARGDLDQAEANYRQALELDETLGDQPGISTSCLQLSTLEQARGNLEAAAAGCYRSLSIDRALGDAAAVAHDAAQLASIQAQRGDRAGAREAAASAITSFAAAGRLEGASVSRDLQRIHDAVEPGEFVALWRNAKVPEVLSRQLIVHVGRWVPADGQAAACFTLDDLVGEASAGSAPA